ncbi:MAG: hypothetical protein H0V01_04485 [Bacteroidetes bacterium]|nr:hypothetical protein [Bacteroidota bacterium]HET6243909.1 hypothetical protein [Bacteroidia bacterium]
MKQFKIFVLLFFLFGCSRNEKVMVYLIPEGYEGPLVLIEDPQAEDTLEIKEDTIVFDFRESVILRLKGKFIEGSNLLSNLKYYYVDNVGNKTEIPIALGNYTQKDSNTVYLHLKHTQIRENSKCDIVSTPENFSVNIRKQNHLCDSLFAIYP